MTAIAAVTIGQAPRPDVVPELRYVLGDSVEILESGALDGLTLEQVRRLNPEPHAPLVTRLRDGTPVIVDAGFIASRVQARLDDLADRVALVALLCTGGFPNLRSRVPILYPERILTSVVQALAPSRPGVLIPLAAQRERLTDRWRRLAPDARIEVASPYGDRETVLAAARRLGEQDVDLVVLDCIGYTREIKALARTATGRPVIQASTALAHVIAELAA